MIQPGTVYRACVPSVDDTRTLLRDRAHRDLPFQNSVTFSGYEPNSGSGMAGNWMSAAAIKRTVLVASILGSGIVFLD